MSPSHLLCYTAHLQVIRSAVHNMVADVQGCDRIKASRIVELTLPRHEAEDSLLGLEAASKTLPWVRRGDT